MISKLLPTRRFAASLKFLENNPLLKQIDHRHPTDTFYPKVMAPSDYGPKDIESIKGNFPLLQKIVNAQESNFPVLETIISKIYDHNFDLSLQIFNLYGA